MEDFKISFLWVRDQPVILDYHLAALYEVKTKRLNEQVRRNRFRFPEDFVFRLTPIEWEKVVADCDHLCKPFYANILPIAFTEQVALMASTVLHSSKAIQMSIYIVRAFVKMRMEMSANEIILRKLAEIDRTLLIHDDGLRDLYEKLMPLLEPNREPEKRKIGFGEMECEDLVGDRDQGFKAMA